MDTLFDFEWFPLIETPRLLLRELRRGDAEAVYSYFLKFRSDEVL